MKLDALFKSQNNTLVTLDGKEVAVAGCPVLSGEICAASGCSGTGEYAADKCCGSGTVCAVEVPWSLVGTEEGGYNEEFLAGLRDWLKVLEEKHLFAFIVPVAGKVLSTEESAVFTASMKHCARRIKDCVSVVGFEVPLEADAFSFEAELREKHGQYIFFSASPKLLEDGSIVRI